MSKSNICLVGLSKEFTDKVCQQLAIKLEMFYANVEELFEYELVDMDKIEQVCGIDYLNKEQLSIIKRICNYDNTLIFMDYKLLNNSEIHNIVKDCTLLVYVRLNKDRFYQELVKCEDNANIRAIEKDLFDDRDFLCKNKSDIYVDCDDLDDEDLTIKIVDKIVKFYD